MTNTDYVKDIGHCDICGEPAVFMICDIRELPPVDGYFTWEKADVTSFCYAHERRPMIYRLDGSVSMMQ